MSSLNIDTVSASHECIYLFHVNESSDKTFFWIISTLFVSITKLHHLQAPIMLKNTCTAHQHTYTVWTKITSRLESLKHFLLLFSSSSTSSSSTSSTSSFSLTTKLSCLFSLSSGNRTSLSLLRISFFKPNRLAVNMPTLRFHCDSLAMMTLHVSRFSNVREQKKYKELC